MTKLSKEDEEAIRNSVFTCVHVLNKDRKYEYVSADEETGAEESFTCSECLDLKATKGFKKAMPFLRLVHRSCFVEARIK